MVSMQTAFLLFPGKVLGKMKCGKDLLLHPAVPCRKQTWGLEHSRVQEQMSFLQQWLLELPINTLKLQLTYV